MDESPKPVDRQMLYDEVWTEPVSIVAPRYGLSDVGLAKVCKRLAIPLPSRGYWAKVRAGKIMGRAALPPLPEGLSAKGPAPVSDEEASRAAGRNQARKEVRRTITTQEVPHATDTEHPLVAKARARLSKVRGWDDPKSIRSAPKEVLDLKVTATSLERALRLANTLLSRLAPHGVVASIDSEKGRTDLAQTGTSMWFSVEERITRRDHVKTPEEERALSRYQKSFFNRTSVPYPHVPRHDYTATGLLTISLGGRNWNDTRRTSLDDRIEAVCADILLHFENTRAKEAEHERNAQRYRAQVEAYEAHQKRRSDEQERLKQLVRESRMHERAVAIRGYVAAALRLGPAAGETADDLSRWAEWALAKARYIDPLSKVSDLILDAPEPEKPGYWWQYA